MKFQFCGNLSCPEWFLAESAILSKITALKLKLVVQHILNHMIDEIENFEKIQQLLENSGFTQEEITSTIASIEFILSNSASYDVSDNILVKELIDLGLPRENVEQIAKIYKQFKDKLRNKQLKSILRISKLKDINFSVNKFILSNEKSAMDGEEQHEYPSKFADLTLKWQNFQPKQAKEQKLIVFQDKLNELVNEMEKAMEKINNYA